MKTKNLMADAWRQITHEMRGTWIALRRMTLLYAFIMAVGCLYMPSTGWTQVTGGGTIDINQSQNVGRGVEANIKTSQLFLNMRSLGGWILLVALVFAGLLAAFGNYKFAWGVAIAAIVIYGGSWIIGLIKGTLEGSNTSA